MPDTGYLQTLRYARKSPKVEKKPRERIILTLEEWQQIIDKFPAGSRYHIPLMIGFLCIVFQIWFAVQIIPLIQIVRYCDVGRFKQLPRIIVFIAGKALYNRDPVRVWCGAGLCR